MAATPNRLFDCVQVNLAVSAARYHGPDAALALGQRLRFRWQDGPDGLPTVEPEPRTQITEGCALAGLEHRTVGEGCTPAELTALVEEWGTLYAIGDAFDMWWLPYANRRHMAHSFLVTARDGGITVIDGYENHTTWGPAEPGTWRTEPDRLPATSLALRLQPSSAGVPEPSVGVDIDPPGPYLDAFAAATDRVAALDRLTAETWLLARSRQLHASFLESLGDLRGSAFAGHVATWERIATQAFLAWQRSRRGRPEPRDLLRDIAAALEADREVFAPP